MLLGMTNEITFLIYFNAYILKFLSCLLADNSQDFQSNFNPN